MDQLPSCETDLREYFRELSPQEQEENFVALAGLSRSLSFERHEAREQAHNDELTGILNRRGLMRAYAGFQAQARIYRGPTHALVAFMDVDDFKRYNDNYSQRVGDEVLKKVAKSIREHIRASDVVGRLGGDEFICFFDSATLSEGEVIAEKIQSAVGDSISDLGLPAEDRPTLTIGIAQLDTAKEFEEMYTSADRVMKEGKRHEKGRFYIDLGEDS